MATNSYLLKKCFNHLSNKVFITRNINLIRQHGSTFRNLRNFSTSRLRMNQTSIIPKEIIPKEEFNDFISVFPKIVTNLVVDDENLGLQEALEYLKDSLQVNLPRSDKICGQILLMAYKHFDKSNKLTEDSFILAWAIELFHTFLLMTNDVLYPMKSRREDRGWPLVDETGVAVINDSFMLESGAFNLVRKHFKDHPRLWEMLKEFHEIVFMTMAGRSLSHMTSGAHIKDPFKNFTKERYGAIAFYKTGSSLIKPVSLAMFLANINKRSLHKEVEKVMKVMAIFYQTEREFLNFTSNEEAFRNDIVHSKCTWLAVEALKKAGADQRQIMENNYGRSDNESIKAIRNLFEDLRLREDFERHKKESFDISCGLVEKMSKSLPCQLFYELMGKIYNIQHN